MWERPLGQVSVLLDVEAAPLRGVDAATPPAPLSIHARFAAIAERMPDRSRGQLGGRHAELRRAEHGG